MAAPHYVPSEHHISQRYPETDSTHNSDNSSHLKTDGSVEAITKGIQDAKITSTSSAMFDESAFGTISESHAPVLPGKQVLDGI